MMKIIVFIISLLLMLLLSFMDIIMLQSENYEPEFYYLSNPIIEFFYVGSLTVNFLIVVFLIIRFSNRFCLSRQSSFSNIAIGLFTVNLILIWSEIIYSSFIFYGGFGRHQNLPFGVNNLGFFGSIFFSTYIIFLLKSKFPNSKNIDFVMSTIIILSISLHYLLYNYLSP